MINYLFDFSFKIIIIYWLLNSNLIFCLYIFCLLHIPSNNCICTFHFLYTLIERHLSGVAPPELTVQLQCVGIQRSYHCIVGRIMYTAADIPQLKMCLFVVSVCEVALQVWQC